jgi:hypothetical protein
MDDLTKKMQGSLQVTENDVISHAVDIFRPIAQEVSMKKGFTLSTKPINFQQDGPWNFEMVSRGDYYIDLNKTRMYMKLKVVNQNGTPIGNTANVAPINFVGPSMISAIEYSIAGKAISDLGSTHFGYKTYLENILSYSNSARETHLKASRYYGDEANKFDIITAVDAVTTGTNQTPAVVPNKGHESRKTMCAGSKEFDTMFPIHSDILQSDRLLPPGITLNVKFKRANDEFVLMSGDGATRYKIQVVELLLYVRYVEVADNIFQMHTTQSNTRNMLLPINRTEIKTQIFPATLDQVYLPNAFTGGLPKSLIIGLLKTTQYEGNITSNPYNFANNGIKYVCIKIDGEVIPSDPYMPEYDKDLFVREYRSFFDNLGIHHDDVGNAVTMEKYKDGMNLYAFDLSPDLCNGFHSHPVKIGNLDILIKLSANMTESHHLFMMAIYNAVINIDKDQKVSVLLPN